MQNKIFEVIFVYWSIYQKRRQSVEEICYDAAHIAEVLDAIKENFPSYFKTFVKNKPSRNFVKNIGVAIEEFEKDREKYKTIFAPEAFDEYEDDPNYFKSETLKNKCPVIRKTLKSPEDELKQYKISFKLADANELLKVIRNICAFGKEYYEQYDPATYEGAKTYIDLEMEYLDEDECCLSGVIGVGIKSRILYKLYPAIFPNASQDSVWSLYFLSGRESFGCEYDSEFLMIDDDNTDSSVIRQNFSYMYQLFAYYAFEIYKLLEREADKINLPLDKSYRYVVVDSFFKSVKETHNDDINLYKSQIPNGGLDYDGA